MKLILSIFLLYLCLPTAWADTKKNSPDGRYTVSLLKDEHNETHLKIMQGDKLLLSTGSGYGGFTEVSWSADSKYLAVVERGTQTTMNLAVYYFDDKGVKLIDLPDFRLNILGRFQKIEGGRYQFDENLSWKKGPALQLVARGSLVDGASNPQDQPDNWYRFDVMIGFTTDEARLLVVSPNQNK